MKKLLAGGLVAVSIAGGSVAVAALSPLGSAAARTFQAGPGTSAPAPAPGAPTDPAPPAGKRGAKLDEVLEGLVADGTLTREQADKVAERLKAAAPNHAGGPRGGRGGHLGFDREASLEAAAAAIGVSVEDLGAGLKAGRSIAEIAQERGVDRQQVIDALSAEATKRIDQAVADGKLTQEQAGAAKGRLGEVIPKVVDAKPGDRSGKGFGRGPGHRGPGGGGQGEQPGSTSPPTTGG